MKRPFANSTVPATLLICELVSTSSWTIKLQIAKTCRIGNIRMPFFPPSANTCLVIQIAPNKVPIPNSAFHDKTRQTIATYLLDVVNSSLPSIDAMSNIWSGLARSIATFAQRYSNPLLDSWLSTKVNSPVVRILLENISSSPISPKAELLANPINNEMNIKIGAQGISSILPESHE